MEPLPTDGLPPPPQTKTKTLDELLAEHATATREEESLRIAAREAHAKFTAARAASEKAGERLGFVEEALLTALRARAAAAQENVRHG